MPVRISMILAYVCIEGELEPKVSEVSLLQVPWIGHFVRTERSSGYSGVVCVEVT